MFTCKTCGEEEEITISLCMTHVSNVAVCTHAFALPCRQCSSQHTANSEPVNTAVSDSKVAKRGDEIDE